MAPVALALLFGYSFTKRFTFLCHLFLGLAIAGGPAGAWIAVRGDFAWPPGLLMIAVACWIGGFDILYALSGLLHAVTVGALVALAPAAHLGAPYLAGVAVTVALLVYEHAIVRPSDLSRLNVAFFTLNGYVSVVFFLATLADVLLR
jgi:4-hydroxybenzoate polyprenyltransferase